MDKAPARAAVVGAFVVIYLVWGSTYLGIAVGVAEIPPFLMAALRFVPAGWAFYAVLRLRGAPHPPASMWLTAALTGGLMLTMGNGMLSIAETRMPSGVAALLVATVPLWLVLLQAASERRRPAPLVLLAIPLGLGGVALLSGEEGGWKDGLKPLYVGLVLLGSFCWATGSLVSRRISGIPATQMAAMQMVAGGLLLTLVAIVRGEPGEWDPGATSAKAWGAVLYLSLFGSILALSSYVWLIQVSEPAMVGTYAFVNPVIAVLLGAGLANEPLSGRILAAGLLIVAAVAAIVWDGARRPRAVPPGPLPSVAAAPEPLAGRPPG